MQHRIPQPPINPSARPTEHRAGWIGFLLVAVGLGVAVWGVLRVTGIETVDGEPANEIQLVKAFANSGLRISDPAALPDPSILNDPLKAAAAFDRLQQRDRKKDKLTYRVDTGAATPCPT